MKKNIAVFASGSGTNAENIIRYFQEDNRLNVSLLVSSRTDAYVLERARALDVPCRVFAREEWKQGEAILSLLEAYQIHFVVLAGFLLRIPEVILHAYPNKIINIHPSLLPRYGGKGMYGDRVHEAVVAAGEQESGITIHYINEHYDEGQVIFQTTCPVLPEDTPAEVACKVHALEYKHYPEVIRRIILSE
ncbi:MAG: phosphoribosylglycinamide formyltransferase [Bacteroides sp.]|nr:phosphoribosylglycinamide formyltransferase [Bacteroides sp.]